MFIDLVESWKDNSNVYKYLLMVQILYLTDNKCINGETSDSINIYKNVNIIPISFYFDCFVYNAIYYNNTYNNYQDICSIKCYCKNTKKNV